MDCEGADGSRRVSSCGIWSVAAPAVATEGVDPGLVQHYSRPGAGRLSVYAGAIAGEEAAGRFTEWLTVGRGGFLPPAQCHTGSERV